MVEPYTYDVPRPTIKVGVIFLYLLFHDLVTFWSRYELIVKKQLKRKSDVKKIFLSIFFYKDKNDKLGSITKSVFIAWTRNGHVLVTVLIFELLIC